VYKNNFVCIALWSEGRVQCVRATDRKRLVIPILKLFCICVHEEGTWHDRVPWGDSLFARKFRDVIATPCVPFAVSITFHESRLSPLVIGHTNSGDWSVDHKLQSILTAVLISVVRWSDALLLVGCLKALYQQLFMLRHGQMLETGGD
jgi:hypothetical protein